MTFILDESQFKNFLTGKRDEHIVAEILKNTSNPLWLAEWVQHAAFFSCRSAQDLISARLKEGKTAEEVHQWAEDLAELCVEISIAVDKMTFEKDSQVRERIKDTLKLSRWVNDICETNKLLARQIASNELF